jgi:succinate dehydrogenase / fumarate reductase cytochrome b subunit
MSNSGRPLSPHLQVYRWTVTMALSILHRVTGLALALGLVVLALWLIHAAAGPEQYQYFRQAMSTPVGTVLLIGWTFAFLLHLANGVRHLVWDAGLGFEIPQANRSAWAAIAFAVVATALLWVFRL